MRDFARTAVGSHRSEIDLEAFAAHPLAPSTVRLLAYLRELERSTMTYLRNVLVTPTHKDARVTAFLTTWAFEKYWIADAFEVIVRAHGVDPTEIEKLPRLKALALEIAERATPIVESFRANAIGPDVIGVHLSTVTVDEWMTEAAYTRLKEVDPHPVLVSLLDRVLEVKSRHRAFVEPDTLARLESSARARGLARRALPRTPWPIGAASVQQTESAFFYEELLTADLADRVDQAVRALPGLGGLHVVASARTATISPSGGLGRTVGRALAGARHALSPSKTTSRKGGANG
ncbi:hypothetical protein [Herbiconiux liangxiaofengii]|uniref:hypothetical protein n=1 Tax=Herbiconiux liangxiaofengii TaxID=3342795 RepID=UPI0035BA0C3B